jgi:hypothetical protein
VPAVRPALRHRPGIPILGRIRFAIESDCLGVVAKDELVLVVAGFFDFVSEAIELALVGIKFPFSDEGIVGSADQGRSAEAEAVRATSAAVVVFIELFSF